MRGARTVDREEADRGHAPRGHETDTEVTAQRIIVRDLSLSCRIGVTEEERARRQRIRLNLKLEVVPDPPSEAPDGALNVALWLYPDVLSH
jgi:hypothetical protein